jgi:hypothetical protein
MAEPPRTLSRRPAGVSIVSMPMLPVTRREMGVRMRVEG